MKQNNIISAIVGQGVLPLYFHEDEKISIEVMQALYDGGLRIIEYTNRGPEAMKNFEAMKKEAVRNMPGMLLALGTVMDVPTGRTAVHLGADCIISPGFIEGLDKYAAEKDILWIPGCMTPTDIIRANTAGIKMVKLFPGNILGPDFMKGIRDIFPEMMFMPTGGVSPSRENLSAWFKAGVSAVGMGSTLISRPVLEKGDYAAITRMAKEVVVMIKEIKS
jgi:2-dehydro-3-deoxyphosphogluconate aldolase/(4S)-4-hydroxy-2-oxoglutarate aldolase